MRARPSYLPIVILLVAALVGLIIASLNHGREARMKPRIEAERVGTGGAKP